MRTVVRTPLLLLALLQASACGAFRSHPDLTPTENVLSITIQANTKAKYVTAALSDVVVDAHEAGLITNGQLIAFDERITLVEDLLLEVSDAVVMRDVDAARRKLIEAIGKLSGLVEASEIMKIQVGALLALSILELERQVGSELEASGPNGR